MPVKIQVNGSREEVDGKGILIVHELDNLLGFFIANLTLSHVLLFY